MAKAAPDPPRESHDPSATSPLSGGRQPPLPAANAKPVIGLVGMPGAGKSTVAAAFAAEGCAVIDADRLAREAMRQHDLIEAVAARFGEGVRDEGVRDEHGGIDRQALAAVVFDDPAARRWLEALIHPIVHRGREAERIAAFADPAVVAVVEDCPLLIEVGLEAGCDAVVLVDVSEEVRRARVLAGRGWDAAELARREGSQLPLDIKRERADYVVRNDAPTPASLRDQVRRILPDILPPPPRPPPLIAAGRPDPGRGRSFPPPPFGHLLPLPFTVHRLSPRP